MALIEKLTYEEMVMLEVISHPILFAEFENNVDKHVDDTPWLLTQYQKEFMCDFNTYVSMCCGRAVGKTVALSETLLWLMVNNTFVGDYLCYTVPNRVHLEPVFNNLTYKLRGNSFLRNFIDPKKGINSGSFTIRLNNGSVLDCRIAGQSGTGANVVGMHTPFIILDEGGFYPWGTWIELLPTRNTWTPGTRLIVSGVPTGLREKNVLYFADEVDDAFTKHRISSHLNPRYSDADERQNIQQYGGVDNEDYVHMVLGRHGSPTFAVFDRRLFSIATYPVFKVSINGTEFRDDLSKYITRLRLIPPIPHEATSVFMGVDLGYTDPTAIIIMYTDNAGRFKFHARISLTKVAFPIQERLIDFLDTVFHPYLIGVDEGSGGGGKNVIQHLTMDTLYVHKKYDKRVIPVNFASNVTINLDADGNEVTEKIKPYSISLLQEYSNTHRIIYSSTDLEMVTELERMTYTKNTLGDLVFKTMTERGGKKGDDHFTAALLCLILSYHQENELIMMRKSPKLLGPRWI